MTITVEEALEYVRSSRHLSQIDISEPSWRKLRAARRLAGEVERLRGLIDEFAEADGKMSCSKSMPAEENVASMDRWEAAIKALLAEAAKRKTVTSQYWQGEPRPPRRRREKEA